MRRCGWAGCGSRVGEASEGCWVGVVMWRLVGGARCILGGAVGRSRWLEHVWESVGGAAVAGGRGGRDGEAVGGLRAAGVGGGIFGQHVVWVARDGGACRNHDGSRQRASLRR